jgi:SAM-dependent methyltransferase
MSTNKYFIVGHKKHYYYKGLLMRADTGLHEQIANTVREKLPNGGKILDFGCGQGAMSLRLHDLGYEMLAVDLDPEDYKCKDVPFEQLNFNDKQAVVAFLTKYKNSFDLVLGVEVIEHVENPWDYVRDLKTMVKPGGYILISTPNTTSWLSRMFFLFTGKFHQFMEDNLEYGHIAPITPYHLGVILKAEDLDEVKTISAGLLPRFWFVANRYLVLFNFLNLFFYPFMKGIKKGWCTITTARKK